MGDGANRVRNQGVVVPIRQVSDYVAELRRRAIDHEGVTNVSGAYILVENRDLSVIVDGVWSNSDIDGKGGPVTVGGIVILNYSTAEHGSSGGSSAEDQNCRDSRGREVTGCT
jgi:hypothetical protein